MAAHAERWRDDGSRPVAGAALARWVRSVSQAPMSSEVYDADVHQSVRWHDEEDIAVGIAMDPVGVVFDASGNQHAFRGPALTQVDLDFLARRNYSAMGAAGMKGFPSKAS